MILVRLLELKVHTAQSWRDFVVGSMVIEGVLNSLMIDRLDCITHIIVQELWIIALKLSCR